MKNSSLTYNVADTISHTFVLPGIYIETFVLCNIPKIFKICFIFLRPHGFNHKNTGVIFNLRSQVEKLQTEIMLELLLV